MLLITGRNRLKFIFKGQAIPLKANGCLLPSSVDERCLLSVALTLNHLVEVDLLASFWVFDCIPFEFFTKVHAHSLPTSLELVQDLERRVCLGAFLILSQGEQMLGLNLF